MWEAEAGMTPAELLELAGAGRTENGPPRLLIKLVHEGLDPGALEFAAGLVVELDRAAGERGG